MKDIGRLMKKIGQSALAASHVLANVAEKQKNLAITKAAALILEGADLIISANQKDLEFSRQKGHSEAMLDRLLLDKKRIKNISNDLISIASQPDPVGLILEEKTRPNGLNIKKISTPLGVIGVIYESRPNVTADAGALAVKSGNAVILRCGSESYNSSKTIISFLKKGLIAADLPEKSIQLVPTRDREAVVKLLTMTQYVDVIVPRGGKNLVQLVQDQARVPIFAHLEGIVHIFVDKTADPQKAMEVVLNSKTRRPGICGAAECLLLHEDIEEGLGAEIIKELVAWGVEVRLDKGSKPISGTIVAKKSDWGKEFLSNIIAVKKVSDVQGAVEHIQTFGSQHTDCIITEDETSKRYFFEKVDSAIIMQNASTQFADGGEFGLGAEIGISTGKMHARGPVGAAELTSFKYLVSGDGNIRP